jgi:23S rRNA pseudouridine1911/1915/1917 synthase
MHALTRLEVTVAEDDAGQTLGSVLRVASGKAPWRRVNKAIRDGKVTIDGQTQRDPATRMRAGMVVRFDPHAHAGRPSETRVRLLHVDGQVVVVDKPAGLLSVPWEDEQDTVQHIAHALVRRQEGQRHLPPLRVVQRLDKETSGVLVFARTRQAERHLAALLRSHDIERRYVALCEGKVVAGTHETHLVSDRGDGRRGSFRGKDPPPHAKHSITHVTRRELFTLGSEAVSLVECTLQTGRQHQIRIHLAEAGHPIVGEPVYGKPNRHEIVAAARPMLHAERLGFAHPAGGRLVRFEAEPPADFTSLVAKLRGG